MRSDRGAKDCNGGFLWGRFGQLRYNILALNLGCCTDSLESHLLLQFYSSSAPAMYGGKISFQEVCHYTNSE